MHFMTAADTDIGISKSNNQDSLLIKHAKTEKGEVLLAVVCDGMGGLSKGEVASSAVIRAFSRWFDEEFAFELVETDMQVIGNSWALMLKELNGKILEYGKEQGVSLGTTFSGILFVDDEYVIAHVGDSRVYYINGAHGAPSQLTLDQTYVAREMALGRMTPEQAARDPKRNTLLQCIGASKKVEPQIIAGMACDGTYMLCSDGFRHVNTQAEIQAAYDPAALSNEEEMHRRNVFLIEQAKSRKERDNISVILIRAENS